MDADRMGRWVSLLANLGVLSGLVFVGLQIRQTNRQLRAEASYSITESVNQINEGVYSDAELSSILNRGELDLQSLNEDELARFQAWQFARLNIADHIFELEAEGISGFGFRYTDFLVNDFRTKPGLRQLAESLEGVWVGSDTLYALITGGG